MRLKRRKFPFASYRDSLGSKPECVFKHFIKFMPLESHHKGQTSLFLYFQYAECIDKVWLDFLTACPNASLVENSGFSVA